LHAEVRLPGALELAHPRPAVEVLMPCADELRQDPARHHPPRRPRFLAPDRVVALERTRDRLAAAEQRELVNLRFVLHGLRISSQRRCAKSADSPVLASGLPAVTVP